VGSGTEQTVSVPTTSGENTLAGLASAINSAGIGVTASVLTDSTGSRLSLVSGTSGASGNLTITSSITDTSNSDAAVSYDTSTAVAGANGTITVDNVKLSVSSNTVSDLIPGVTFKLLSTSDTTVQVVIANYNSGVESSVSTLVSDYNALVSAINTQEGNDSSGNAEPLYGSPTLTMLQQDILGGVNSSNPNGYLDAVSTTTGTTLSGSMTIKTASGFLLSDSVTAGSDADTSTDTSAVTSSATLSATAADTLSGSISIKVGSGTAQTISVPTTSGDNTISGLADAINNTTDIGVKATVTTTDGKSALTLTSDTSGSAGSLTVTSSVYDTSAQTINVPTTSGDNTLSGLVDAINTADIGVTAAVVTNNGKSTLTLTSQTTGSSGALTVTSAISATSDTAVSATVTAGSAADTSTDTSAVTSSATLSATAADTLSGSISIKVGSGTAQTINVPSGATLADLADTINNASIGVKAAAVTTNGTTALTLTSGTSGSNGTLTVTSSILDTTNTSTSTLSYASSSDLGSLSALGVTVNTDGTLSLDATTLDSVLNSDYSSVAGFFQNADSWGATFAAMLTSAGTSSSTGILKLAETANSSNESSLNKNISREESLISAQQISLTKELTSANEIMQMIPTELSEISELYSAITGYKQSSS
jgi:flagellar hook-associated protein 2